MFEVIRERIDTMIPFLDGKNCKEIALCMDDAGMPQRHIINQAFVTLMMDAGMDKELLTYIKLAEQKL
jgi:hypothetical protein